MKKLSILAVAVIFSLGMTSCKKDWTCKCTTTVTGAGSTTSTVTIKDKSKKDAKSACEGTASAPGVTQTCEIE